jgi:hypothetical protein
MTLPVGTISMSQVNVELQLSATTPISLNQANVRSLAGVPSGTISMNNLRGKTYYFVFTPPEIISNTPNYNLKSAAIAAGWDQVRPLNATIRIGSGVYVYSTSTGAYAFQTGSTFPTGSLLRLDNYGTILGAGGAGGVGAKPEVPYASGGAGTSGGPAFLAQYPITVYNYGSIAGGGGGGGGGNAFYA